MKEFLAVQENKMIKKAYDKRGMETEFMGWLLLVLLFLLIGAGAVIILKGKGFGAVDFIKNIFKFRG
ncbi:hypothetical protein COU61_00730 [Candidatus Pacearchaeota archaeon CG10_big_fil_rev_8_21_14_0_10_35_13]|nr:MAG: hypothetical protein COU61_00730 [Candidatus Pacearchaeota archaeon CG10_big_fil_rev_8_21_14_0_10_35_13]